MSLPFHQLPLNSCVGGILLKESKLLLGKRSGERAFYPRVWDLIGGHVENYETPEQALMRELQGLCCKNKTDLLEWTKKERGPTHDTTIPV